MLFYVVELCFVPFFFPMSFIIKTLQKSNLNTIWDCSDYKNVKVLENFGLYDPKPPDCMDCGVTPKVWTVCGVFNTFLVCLCIVNVFFDCSYNLR